MPLLPGERPEGLDAFPGSPRRRERSERPSWGGSPWAVRFIRLMSRTQVREYETPLLHLDDGPGLAVVASQGGLPKDPPWYANLLARPDTTVSLRGERDRPVRARPAGPGERAALWPRLVDLYADFAKYQKWTDREIPVIVLEPR